MSIRVVVVEEDENTVAWTAPLIGPGGMDAVAQTLPVTGLFDVVVLAELWVYGIRSVLGRLAELL